MQQRCRCAYEAAVRFACSAQKRAPECHALASANSSNSSSSSIGSGIGNTTAEVTEEASAITLLAPAPISAAAAAVEEDIVNLFDAFLYLYIYHAI